MREIKFRAWSSASDVWREDWSISSYEKILDLNEERIDDDLILEQYTGLKDEKGKEIYEGDIITYHNAPGLGDAIAVIVWDDLQAGFFISNDAENVYEPIWNIIGYCKIVGNIHENPELLEVK